MNIRVLSYIDTSSINNTAANNTVVDQNPASPAATSSADFGQVFDSAKKATAAIIIDDLVKKSETGSVDASIVQQFFDQHGINIQIATNQAAPDAVSGTSVSSQSSASASDVAASDSSAASGSTAAECGDGLECSPELDIIFDTASQTYGVDAKFLKSIAKCESDFDANCVSHSGAVGIMQLMPGTAAELGVTDSYDPYQNIMGGSQYISELLEKYNGDKSLALAAYNAGSGNVSKYGGIPPFTETQNYVKKVLGYYNS